MNKKLRKSGSKHIVKSQFELAKILQVTSRTIRSWKIEGLPVEKNGCYDLQKIISWRLEKEQKKSKVGNPELRRHEVEYRKYRALQVKLDFEIKSEKYLSSAEVETTCKEAFLYVKKRLLDFAKQVCPQLEGIEVLEMEAIVSDRIKEIIREFGRGFLKNEHEKKSKK